MVYLTMTTSIVEALEKIQGFNQAADEKSEPRSEHDVPRESLRDDEGPAWEREETDEKKSNDRGETRKRSLSKESILRNEKVAADRRQDMLEPSLLNPRLGSPISHGQVIDLSRQLKAQGLSPWSLDVLLRGAKVYVAPPPPKPVPTSEYRALMARLRREEEARSYERLTNPPPSAETFAQRFPSSSAAHAFSFDHPPEPDPIDEVTYADVNRQMMLVLNVLLSIVACAGAIWVAARWWSTPARLALSMSGSVLVGVAEVVVYSGYIRRVGESKGKEKGVKEVKEVVRTWVVGGGEDEQDAGEQSVLIESKMDTEDVKARMRKKNVS